MAILQVAMLLHTDDTVAAVCHDCDCSLLVIRIDIFFAEPLGRARLGVGAV